MNEFSYTPNNTVKSITSHDISLQKCHDYVGSFVYSLL